MQIPTPRPNTVPTPPYIELHCHSGFSFLDGASHPEELVFRALELGYPAMALTDHNGLYGSMEFAQAARAEGLQPITGAEVTVALDIPGIPEGLDGLGVGASVGDTRSVLSGGLRGDPNSGPNGGPEWRPGQRPRR